MKHESENEMELGRVERGVQLACEPIGDGRYRVSGGGSVHWVDLKSSDHPRCDCGDYLWRESICKHIIAARLREGDEAALSKLGILVRSMREEVTEQRRALKKASAA